MALAESARLHTSDDLLVCMTCGTQYDVRLHADLRSSPSPSPSQKDNHVGHPGGNDGISVPASETPQMPSCRICDDPRQFVPPSGQAFTTLGRLQKSGQYSNQLRQHEQDPNVWTLWTEPKFAIGQRAFIIRTPHGNVLWDLIAYLDQDTVDQINAIGGLALIVVSHPHFYTTWADWSTTFSCPVYLSAVDAHAWANRQNANKATLKLLTEPHTELLPGMTAIQAGGHFDGSLILHTAPPITAVASIFVADTIFHIPAGRNPDPAKPGVPSYAFMWSIPNMIPLSPDQILRIWKVLCPFEFVASYGLMEGMAVRERVGDRRTLKQRVLDSAKIVVERAGWRDHAIFAETA